MTNQTIAMDEDYDALLNDALAQAIAEGDIVNFRLLFSPASPFREESPEDASTPKYDYLFPESDADADFQAALALVNDAETAAYVRAELARKGPPRLPWHLVLALSDNAVRLGKYTPAAQGYELLRIRRRMQDILLEKADAQLQQGGIDQAVRGYCVALGLQYDYGAFPEPLPAVPDYQERAPGLHTAYPASADQAPALQEDDTLCITVLNYLMPFKEFTSRFQALSGETRIAFTAGLVRALDQDWDAFAKAFRETQALVKTHAPLFEKLNTYSADVLEILAEELVPEDTRRELRTIPAMLTGITGKNWEWWQYLKTLAFYHPGAAVFVSRQRISAREEILTPKLREDSGLGRELGLIR